MFIAKYPSGEIISENQMVWDNAKDGISKLELTIPIPVTFQDAETGQIKEAPARTISIENFDRYFFYNEAAAVMEAGPDGKLIQKAGSLIAKAIGGIDDKSGQVFEIKIDRSGFASARHYPVSELQIAKGIKSGAK